MTPDSASRGSLLPLIKALSIRRGERLNGYTHLFGLVAALAGTLWLLVKAGSETSAPTDPLKLAGALVFSVCAIALYAASALCHGSTGRMRLVWQRADHCAIYLLIAGTCTPFVLAALSGLPAIGLLAVVWAGAAWGIARELRTDGTGKPSLRYYVVLGWLCVMVAAPLAARLDRTALAGLLAGALFYTVGTVFYLNRPGWVHGHGVWHLFVLGGTMTHYVTVARLAF